MRTRARAAHYPRSPAAADRPPRTSTSPTGADPPTVTAAVRASAGDLALVAAAAGWITLVLLADTTASLPQQRVLGLLTWAGLAVALCREERLVRAQTAVVIGFATAVEYTFSPLLEVYVYRFDNVPWYVPPGHGLVYLAALALGRTPLLHRYARPFVVATVVLGGTWAVHGLLAERTDVLGAFWYLCLVGFLAKGRAPLLYVGAFVVVSYLEVLGTALGTWEWQARDPTGLVPIGNPPSGAAGGYGWFDLAAVIAAPALLARWDRGRRRVGYPRDGVSRLSTSSWSTPLVATASAPRGPSLPSRSVNRPPASSTTIETAAMSCRASSGSAATSTAPSATSTYDQKSPYARERQQLRTSSRKGSSRPTESQPSKDE
ncbi:MAG TPA: hypothetical protein VK908_02025 [Jiangellales bacterium]|nr:hypothetical protein [Jiangellales bacterium]